MEETTLDIRDIIKVLKKRSGFIVSVFLIFVFLATVISFIIPPTYEAETNLRIKQPKGLANSLLADLPMGNSGNTKQLMSTYAEILKSRTVVQEVIEKTQLGKAKIPTYENMLNTITTQPVKDTEILKVKVQAKSAVEAVLVANTLVNTFNERMTFLVRSEQTVVREFIGERLQESKKDLEKAEYELQKYKFEQKIVAPADETKAMVDRLASIDKLSAENAVASASAQAKQVNALQQLGKEKPGFIADSPLIQQYKGKLAELEVQLVSLSQNYADQHPQVLAARAAIDETKVKLKTEISRVVNAEAPSMNPIHLGLLQGKIQAEAEIAATAAQKAALNQIIVAGEQELSQLPAKERGLAKVLRDVAVSQEIYVMLAKRHEEARISEVMQPTDVQVIDVAIAQDRPVAPKKALNISIAAILGIFIGVAIAFALEYMNKTVRNADDVKQYLDLPVLGNIPDFDSKEKSNMNNLWTKFTDIGTKKSIDNAEVNMAKEQNAQRQLIVHEKSKSPIAEAYRTLRTNISFSKVDGELQTIMFTSAGPGEGKSTTAANTAVAIAQSGKRVVIIDCDLRKPVQHKIFDLPNKGITNILFEKLAVADYIQSTEVENLRVITSGPIPPNPSELLDSAKIREIIDYLKTQADYIIVDAPPVVAVTDASVLASKVDGIILVLDSGGVRPDMAQKAVELLKKAQGHMLGVILNKVEIEEEYAYYYYYYGSGEKTKKVQ